MIISRILASGIIAVTLPWGGFSAFGGVHRGHYFLSSQTAVTQPVTTGPAQQPTQTGESQAPQQNVPAGANSSYNWAGYVATGGGRTGDEFTSVAGTWIVPTVAKASSMEADTVWVGIGGVTSEDLVQAGTQTIADPSGGVSYEAWYETLPETTSPLNVTIHPGDSVTASVTETATPGEWQVAFRDNTTGGSASLDVQYNSSLSSAEWIAEMPLNGNLFVPLDHFGNIPFTNGTTVMNGNTVSIAGAGAQPLTMVTNAGDVLVSTSALGGDGASFTATRTSASSASAGSDGIGFVVPSNRPWRRRVVGVEGYTRGSFPFRVKSARFSIEQAPM